MWFLYLLGFIIGVLLFIGIYIWARNTFMKCIEIAIKRSQIKGLEPGYRFFIDNEYCEVRDEFEKINKNEEEN